MINGFHTLVYSDDAPATRAFFRDVLGWSWIDAHGGWLIFKAPPAELGVHPTADATERAEGAEGAEGAQEAGARQPALPAHEAWLMCDDLEATITELRAKGVDISDDIESGGFGRFTSMQVPGAGPMMVYQPRHPVAYDLDP
jgi:catechol 2,3-dioxygenase-like lactoylglutathione lyase family enzyme